MSNIEKKEKGEANFQMNHEGKVEEGKTKLTVNFLFLCVHIFLVSTPGFIESCIYARNI